MHFLVLSALFALALPALAATEPKPYRNLRRAMTAEEIFGIAKRQTAGYAPGSTTTCSGRGTCERACGAGYRACGVGFCYLPASQVCCAATSEACDDGYYCTVDSAGDPWCCPNGDDLAACAAVYGVTGLSTVATAAATSTAPSTPSTSAVSTPSTYTTAATTAMTNSTATTPPVLFTGAAFTHAAGGFVLPLLLAGAAAAL